MNWMLVAVMGAGRTLGMSMVLFPTQEACEAARAAYIETYLPEYATPRSLTYNGTDNLNARRTQCLYVGVAQ